MSESKPNSPKPYCSGFIAILGLPNVGKSTLLNAILGEKIAIVSPKPQTTRDRISGILSTGEGQIVFVDTPGVMAPRDLFNESLRDAALEAIEGADLVYHLIDAGDPRPLPPEASQALARSRTPAFAVFNKIDQLSAGTPLPALPDGDQAPGPDRYQRVFHVSALEGSGLDELLAASFDQMPEGPPLYDPDLLTDRDMRFLAAEIVREKVLEFCQQEIPYSVACRTEEYRERENAKHYVGVTIYVEHESQKGIVIGAGGAMLRQVGAAARPEIESLADHPIFLELWVKVRHKWRKKESDLREFGYRTGGARKSRKGSRRR